MVKRKKKNKILTIGVGITILLISIVLALGIQHAYAQSHYQLLLLDRTWLVIAFVTLIPDDTNNDPLIPSLLP